MVIINIISIRIDIIEARFRPPIPILPIVLITTP